MSDISPMLRIIFARTCNASENDPQECRMPARLRCRHCQCPRMEFITKSDAFGYKLFKCLKCNRKTAKNYDEVKQKTNRERDYHNWIDSNPGNYMYPESQFH